MHKRIYGNKLVFLDIREDLEPVKPATPAEATDLLQHAAVEVVFAFEVYGTEVRRIGKDICVGDIVEFHGTYRSCGRILDVLEYSMRSRWREVTSDPFDPAKYGLKRKEHGGKSAGFRLGGPGAESAVLMCKFWLSNKACPREGCQCEHPEGEELAEARRQYWGLLREKRARSANPNDPHSPEGKNGHAQRAAVFAGWLCEVFGLDTLRATGVIDIAGGRGALSFELAVKLGIPCVVIDPRCPSVGKVEAWAGFKVSKPQRSWLEASLPGVNGYPACQAHVASCPHLRQCSALVLPGCADQEATTRAWWTEVVGNAHVIVGLHPDQATGGVLDLATAFGKAFAVVPCCTFADDFPERTRPDGKPVRTYDDLVLWLKMRRSGTETSFLPFQGKNQVVFNANRMPSAACLQLSVGDVTVTATTSE